MLGLTSIDGGSIDDLAMVSTPTSVITADISTIVRHTAGIYPQPRITFTAATPVTQTQG